MTFTYFYACIQYFLGLRPLLPIMDAIDYAEFETYVLQHQLQLAFGTFLLKDRFPCLNGSLLLQHHLLAKQYLFRIIEAFDTQDIPYIVLKGIPLNQQLYGNQCIRQSKDIDLLVRQEQLTQANDCLIDLGFCLHSEFTPNCLEKTHKKIYMGLKDLSYRHRKFPIQIELHWRTAITCNFGFNFETIESYRQMILIGSMDVFILSNEYNFVYLCIHGAISHWRRLKWLLDIAVFVQKQSLSWEEVQAIAIYHHAGRCVFEACQLLAELGLVLPAMQVSITDRLAIGIHRWYIRRLWRACTPSAPIEQLFQLLLHPHLKQKIDFFCNRLLFRSPCRKKIRNNPNYALWRLFFIGLFTK